MPAADEPVPATVEERLEFLELEVGDLALRQDRHLEDLRQVRLALQAALDEEAGR